MQMYNSYEMIILLLRHEKDRNPVIWNDMDGP